MPISAQLLNPQSLYLTGNTSTLYAIGHLDLKTDGPLVVELPPGMLGFLDDAWLRFVGDLGVIGPDKGKGGKYLLLPPGYEGAVPEGYFVAQPPTYNNLILPARLDRARAGPRRGRTSRTKLKMYPLAKAGNNPPADRIRQLFRQKLQHDRQPATSATSKTCTRWCRGTHRRDRAGIRGSLAAIGIVKGKPFNPDARMKRLLNEAATSATPPRAPSPTSRASNGSFIYPDTTARGHGLRQQEHLVRG